MKIFFSAMIILSVYSGWEFGSTVPEQPEERTIDYITDNQKRFDIIHYNLSLDLDLDKRMIKGDIEITGLLKSAVKNIDLNFYNNMNIEELSVNGSGVEYRHDNNLLTLTGIPEDDTAKIKIRYKGRPKKGGLSGFVFGERKGEPVVYNLNEPNYASTWFPCNDFPADKALLDILITNDSSMVSVSNGKLVNINSNVNGKRTYHWKTVYPLSTYLISVYSAPYKSFSDTYISQDRKDTMNIDYYVFGDHLEKARVDFEDHVKFMNYFASTFGEYPFIKEKYGVAEFLWQLGAMEHQTISGIGSNFVSGRKFFNDVYAHELAHHWWGNAVGPASWKDIWLNEGFAAYSEALYAEHSAGKEALQSTMMSKFDENPKGTLYAPQGNLFSPTVYDKGAWVLHMLRDETGDSLFFRILREYFNKYKYRNASTEDFINVCEEVSGKDLDFFFRQWVTEGTDLLRLIYKWNAFQEGNTYSAKIMFEQAQEDYSEYSIPLEMEFLLANGTTERRRIRINKRKQEIETGFSSIPVEIKIDPDNRLLAVIKNRVWD